MLPTTEVRMPPSGATISFERLDYGRVGAEQAHTDLTRADERLAPGREWNRPIRQVERAPQALPAIGAIEDQPLLARVQNLHRTMPQGRMRASYPQAIARECQVRVLTIVLRADRQRA